MRGASPRQSDNNKRFAIVSGITVADTARYEKSIVQCGIAQQTCSRAFSIELNRFDWGTELIT